MKTAEKHLQYNELYAKLRPHVPLHAARVKCLTWLILALCKVQRVNFNALAQGFGTSASLSSNQRRIQRFFARPMARAHWLTPLLLALLPAQAPYHLSLDRTNWKFGSVNINYLVVGVCYRSVALPIVWVSLGNKKGNSNQEERKQLFDYLLRFITPEQIASLTADREFIGSQWWDYLQEKKIPFFIRIRQNMNASEGEGKTLPVFKHFSHLRLHQAYTLGKSIKIKGIKVYLSGMRYWDKKEKRIRYLIIATHNKPYTVTAVFERYQERWQIETLFRALKSSGFHLEATHITDPERLNRLLSVVAIAFVWAYQVGDFLDREEKAIPIKKHQRKAVSVVKYGLENLAHALINNLKNRVVRFLNLFLSCT